MAKKKAKKKVTKKKAKKKKKKQRSNSFKSPLVFAVIDLGGLPVKTVV